MTLQRGSSVGPYRLLEPLGRGGMATVFRAYEAGLDRDVALKVLPREFLHEAGFAERFSREARVVARLEHPNITPIHNFGIDEQSGTPWMAMRLISGGALSGIMKNTRLSAERTVVILRGVAEALDYAHGKGVVHRDVKPQNILLDDAERVYLADFGIAKMVEGQSGLTATGMISGTPDYMAPEQATGGKVDHRADIYALGIVAYEMLAGRVPFAADTPVAVLLKHVSNPMPVPPPSEVSEALVRVLLKALAKRPEDRWPSALAFVNALEHAVERPSLGPIPASAPAMAMPAEPRHQGADAPIGTAPARPIVAARGTPTLASAPGPHPARMGAPAARVATAGPNKAWVVAGVALAVPFSLMLAAGLWRALRPTPPEVSGPSPSVSAGLERPRATALNLGPSAAPSKPPTTLSTPLPPALANTLPTAAPTARATPVPAPTPATSPSSAMLLAPSPSASRAPRSAASGTLRVVVRPWAEVTIDGSNIGTTPFVPPQTLAPGPHVVLLSNPSFPPVRREIMIGAGETSTLEIDLRKAER